MVCIRRARHLNSPRDDRAISRITASNPPSWMLTYVSVRSASRRGFFLVLHRNIAVIRVCLSAGRSQSPSLSRAYFANNCVKSPFVYAHVRSSKLRLSTGALSRTSSEHCLSAVRRTGVNEFVTPVTQTVAYIGYAPVCGGGAFAYFIRTVPRRAHHAPPQKGDFSCSSSECHLGATRVFAWRLRKSQRFFVVVYLQNSPILRGFCLFMHKNIIIHRQNRGKSLDNASRHI